MNTRCARLRRAGRSCGCCVFMISVSGRSALGGLVGDIARTHATGVPARASVAAREAIVRSIPAGTGSVVAVERSSFGTRRRGAARLICAQLVSAHDAMPLTTTAFHVKHEKYRGSARLCAGPVHHPRTCALRATRRDLSWGKRPWPTQHAELAAPRRDPNARRRDGLPDASVLQCSDPQARASHTGASCAGFARPAAWYGRQTHCTVRVLAGRHRDCIRVLGGCARSRGSHGWLEPLADRGCAGAIRPATGSRSGELRPPAAAGPAQRCQRSRR